jgi:putative endonuclease
MKMENIKIVVYILECSDGSYYVGCSSDISQRIMAHNQGVASKWTAKRLPVRLVYSKYFNTLIAARRRERQIKKWSRNKKERLINGELK